VRDRLVEEVRSGSGDTYLAATIKESTRLRSPVIDAVRIATRDTELNGLPVPAGAFVSAMFCAMHLDQDLWSDPLAFRPERHLETKHDTWSLTPFGGGARRCLGAALAQLELEVVLREVLSRSVPEAAGAPEAVRLLGVTLIPAAGGRVRMTSRVSRDETAAMTD
jgi:cytochrome P450